MLGANGFFSRHALLLIIGLGAVLRFATLGAQDLWLDEVLTLKLIELGPIDLLRSVHAGESNPALYYLAAGGWERIFGDSEIGVRSLSALVGTATIPAVYAAAKALSSRRAGLIAAGLTATSPLLIWYSQEARNYSLLVFLSALSFFFFARALEEQRGQRWLLAWALASALALTTHFYAIALIVPTGAWLLARRPGPRLDTAFGIGAIAVVGLALLPHVAARSGGSGWIDYFSLSDRLWQLPAHFVVGFSVPWDMLALLAVAVAAGFAVFAAIRAEQRTRRAIVIAASVALSPVAVLLAVALAGDDYIVTRYLIELWVPFAVALAVALGATAVGRAGTLTAFGLCALGVGLATWTAATPEAQRPNYSDLGAELAAPPDDERLVVSQTGFSIPLIFYLDGARIATDEELRTSELVVITPRLTENYSVGPCWWISTCGGIDLEPVPPFAPPQGFEFQSNGSTEGFDYDVYTAPRPTAIERPVEYVIPRVFVQPAG